MCLRICSYSLSRQHVVRTYIDDTSAGGLQAITCAVFWTLFPLHTVLLMFIFPTFLCLTYFALRRTLCASPSWSSVLHARHLRGVLSLVWRARRSAARNEKRVEALRECVRMITASAGGCTTPFPFEAAIWLLEEQEELYGGSIPIYKTVRPPFQIPENLKP